MKYLDVVIVCSFFAGVLPATVAQGGESTDPVCRPPPDPPPVPINLRPRQWATQVFDVAVRGRYTKPFPSDATVAATKISLKSIGLGAGDYIALRAQGQYFTYRGDPRPFQALGAVFFANSKTIGPGNFGQDVPFSFYDSPGNTPYGVNPHDFDVPADREVIVRIPKNATSIAFSVPDWFVADNCPPKVVGPNGYDCASTGFSVIVSQPNKEGKKINPLTAATEDGGENWSELKLAAIDISGVPEAKFFSFGPFSATVSAATDGQWRGAYAQWTPAKSQYGADRGGGKKHWGWDIFAPAGSKLIAPAWPSQMTIAPYSQDFGNSVVFSFTWKGKVHHIAYSHLKGTIGIPRYINGPEEVGFAGCTGLASQEGCGSPYPNGTRNDHVHVGLFQRTAQPIDANACNPASILQWKIR